MFHGHASRPRRSVGRAFTLAELLIVIAIIGVLISILLPTLGAARRSANSVKCLSSLKQIGSAFQMYAQDNRRAYPVAYWDPGSAYVTTGTASVRPWTDFLVKYVHKRDPSMRAGGTEADVAQYNGAGSVLWGCPSFSAELFNNPTVLPGALQTANMFNTGYGMSVFAMAPYAERAGIEYPAESPKIKFPGSAASPGNLAYLNSTTSGIVGPAYFGDFIKMEKWSRHGADKCLVADSNSFILGINNVAIPKTSSPSRSQLTMAPFAPGAGSPPTNYVDVDGARHMAPGSSIAKVRAARATNVLFADGHAAAVSPAEAWIAIRGGGMDLMQP